MKTYRTLITSLALGLLLTLSGFTGIAPTKTADALSSSDFKAGRIIDDLLYYQSNSMSVQAIQDFLNAKVPSCDTNGTQPYAGTTAGQYGTSKGSPPPYTCLKSYQAATVAKTAETGLCNGYPQTTQSAAQIIYGVAQSCGISPKVLIVLLQKEQGLVTDNWPWPTQYQKATGYGCPDTAACDSQYYGFFNQVYSAARQFKNYAKNPNNYNYISGRNNSIQFSPSSSCGSSVVFIRNQATAGLYNYTPYQPNPSALSGMSDSSAGSTVTCGAYGNRNFFWYYNKWFGPTIRDLITSPGMGVYQVENGAKRAFPNEITFTSYSNRWSDVLTVTNAEINSIPDGTIMDYNAHYRDGHLVTSPGRGIFIVDNGTKRAFPNEGTFFSYGYTFSDALVISNQEVELIPDGTPLSYNNHLRDGHLVSAPGVGIYIVDNGTKRPFPNEMVYLSYKYGWNDALVISSAELRIIPEGTPMAYNPNFRNGFLVTAKSKGIYVVDSGTKRPFPNESTFFSYGYKFSDALVIGGTELDMIPEGTPMPPKS